MCSRLLKHCVTMMQCLMPLTSLEKRIFTIIEGHSSFSLLFLVITTEVTSDPLIFPYVLLGIVKMRILFFAWKHKNDQRRFVSRALRRERVLKLRSSNRVRNWRRREKKLLLAAKGKVVAGGRRRFNHQRAEDAVFEDYWGPDPLFDDIYFERVFIVTKAMVKKLVELCCLCRPDIFSMN